MQRSQRFEGGFRVGDRVATWVRDGELSGRPRIILAHGAGAPLTHPFMEHTARELVARGFTVARFHFPYMQRIVDTGKRRPPDAKGVLLDTWEAMLDEAQSWPGEAPIIAAGKSMGGRMASMLLAEGRAPSVRSAVYLGYPLHPPGRHDKLRSEHLSRVTVPQLFISGSRDSLCRLDLLQGVLQELGEDALLHVVEGGDHSLSRSRKNPLADTTEWLDRIVSFIGTDPPRRLKSGNPSSDN